MNQCFITFNSRLKIDIIGGIKCDHLIEIYEYRNGNKEFIQDFILPTNNFFTYLREWYGDYQIEIYDWHEDIGLHKLFEHRYNDEGKSVLINLDTEKLSEALVWFNKSLEYKDIHKCDLFIKSNFKDDIKNIDNSIIMVDEIIEDNYYAIYHIGKYDTEYEWNRRLTENDYKYILTKNLTYCSYRNPRDWHNLSLDDIAGDILGLNKI